MSGRFFANFKVLLALIPVIILVNVLLGFNGSKDEKEDVKILRPSHAFIHSAYYYRGSSKSLGKNAVAIVMSLNKFTADRVLDININIRGTNTSLKNYSTKAKLSTEHRLDGACEYITVLAQTNTLDNMGRLEIESNGVADKLDFKRPLETSPSNVVFCVAPQLAADEWQAFLRQVHVAKRYGAHLHVYVISMVEKYYKLLEAYQKLGYISIEPWLTVKFSNLRERVAEPQKNIELLMKTAAFTDCILNYKEAAEFVGSIEMDDLLIPTGANSYYEEFERQYDGSFIYSGLTYSREVYEIQRNQDSEQLSIFSGLQNATLIKREHYGRTFVRPTRFNSTWLHWSRNADLTPKYMTEGQFLPSYTKHKQVENNRILNFKEVQGTGRRNGDLKEVITDFNDIEADLKKHLELPQIKQILPYLPKDIIYTSILNNCFDEIPTDTKSNEETLCMDLYKCELPIRNDFPCVHSDGLYSSMLPMRPITYHWASQQFFSRNIGCNI